METDDLRREETNFMTAGCQFEREKYESLLKQSKRAIQEKDKQIGKLQIELIDTKNRIKKI